MTTETWITEYEYELPDGTKLEVGLTFKCFGEKGKTYRFIKAVTNPNIPSTWIDCFGGSHSKQQSRSLDPERINPASVKRPKKRKVE